MTWPRRGFPRVRACPTGSWGFPPFFRVFSDMLCSTPRLRSQCGISKSTFDSLSHSIEGQSAFTQDCDWLYIEAALTSFFSLFFITHVLQVTKQIYLQCPSIPRDFLRAWLRLSWYVLHIVEWGKTMQWCPHTEGPSSCTRTVLYVQVWQCFFMIFTLALKKGGLPVGS